MRSALAMGVILVGTAALWASGASFAITGKGIALGEAMEAEGDDQPPFYRARAVLGEPFTLVAQGIVLPRGGKAEPGEPESGEWTFDAKRFKKLAPEKGAADKTKVAIRLEPTEAGPSRVRFVGKILGRESTFDIRIDVAAGSKK